MAARPKRNSFAALACNGAASESEVSDSDSEAKEGPLATPATRTPAESVCCEDGSEGELSGEPSVWATVVTRTQRRHRERATGCFAREGGRNIGAIVEARTPRGHVPQYAVDDEDDGTTPADAEFFLRKGQRHAFAKVQKQEWSFKAKQRVDAAKEKRECQRASCGTDEPIGGE